MADEIITVEWIATAQSMLTTIQKIDAKIERQEKMMQKLTDTSKKGADAAAGSFNKLEQELKQNEAALADLQMGTKAFADQKKKVDELRASFNGAKQAMASNQSALGALGNTAVQKLGGLAAGMTAFKMVLEAAIAELERAQQVRLKASTTMQSVEGAIADMALNIGADNVAQARGMIEQNAPQLGVTQEGLASMLAAGISGGAKDLDEALKLSSATLKLTAGDAQKAIPIMSGMLTMASTTGNRDFESTLGQLSQFQEAARGEDLAVSIGNMATAMAAANTDGERISALGSERTLELASVMSQLLQDKDMSITGTTMRQMFSKMDNFIPKTSATLDDGTKSTLSRDVIEAFNKLGTMDERMQAMRANPEIAKQFLSTIEENQGKSAVRSLVTGTDKARELETAAAAIVTSQAQAKQDFDALVTVIAENTKNLQAANKSKAADQVTDAKTALEGSIIEAFNRAVDGMTNASGLDSFTLDDATNAMKIRMASGQDAATAATNTLEELKKRDTAFGFIPVGGSVSQDDQSKLDAQISVIKELADDIKALEQGRLARQLNAEAGDIARNVKDAGPNRFGQNDISVQKKTIPDQNSNQAPSQNVQQIELVDNTSRDSVSEVKQIDKKKENAKQFVEQNDANKDGNIDVAEMQSMFNTGALTEKNKEAIKGIRTNPGEDFVSKAELQKVLLNSGGLNDLIQLQRENNELLRQQQQGKTQQRPPQAAVRPKEAPLPAATAP